MCACLHVQSAVVTANLIGSHIYTHMYACSLNEIFHVIVLEEARRVSRVDASEQRAMPACKQCCAWLTGACAWNQVPSASFNVLHRRKADWRFDCLKDHGRQGVAGAWQDLAAW